MEESVDLLWLKQSSQFRYQIANTKDIIKILGCKNKLYQHVLEVFSSNHFRSFYRRVRPTPHRSQTSKESQVFTCVYKILLAEIWVGITGKCLETTFNMCLHSLAETKLIKQFENYALSLNMLNLRETTKGINKSIQSQSTPTPRAPQMNHLNKPRHCCLWALIPQKSLNQLTS